MNAASEVGKERTGTVPKIALRGVSKSFRSDGEVLPVLESVDFYAADGEFVSLIGPSGCGKSTLLSIIAGLEEPGKGTILLDGQPAHQRLGKVGYMHQKDLLLPWRTVLENAILGLEVQGVRRAEARGKVKELLEQFGLNGFEKSFPWKLSGGMRQRAAFLRTVIADQEVILLDEPFGALDALTRLQMQEWLLRIWDNLKKTVVLVTHDVDEAILLSDRIYVLTARPGRVKLVLPVDLPRPRRYRMVIDEVFVTMKARLLASLHEEGLEPLKEPRG